MLRVPRGKAGILGGRSRARQAVGATGHLCVRGRQREDTGGMAQGWGEHLAVQAHTRILVPLSA